MNNEECFALYMTMLLFSDDYCIFVDGAEKCLKLMLDSTQVTKLTDKLKEVRKLEITGKKTPHATII